MFATRNLIATLALPLLAACTEFDFTEQDVGITFDVEADVLELVIDTRGIYGTPMGSSETEAAIDERAAGRVRQMAEGYRYFHILTWPFVFDLDEIDEGAAEDIPPATDPELVALREDLLRLGSGVTVTKSRAYVDSNGEVAVSQRVQVEHATELMKVLNDTLSTLLVRSLTVIDGEVVDQGVTDVFESIEARALLLNHAKAGRDWVTLDGEGISVYVPMTPRDLAQVVRQSFDLAGDGSESAQRAAAVGRAFFHDLDRVEVDGSLVTFRFPFGDDASIDLPLRSPQHKDAPRLRAQFKKGDLVD